MCQIWSGPHANWWHFVRRVYFLVRQVYFSRALCSHNWTTSNLCYCDFHNYWPRRARIIYSIARVNTTIIIFSGISVLCFDDLTSHYTFYAWGDYFPQLDQRPSLKVYPSQCLTSMAHVLYVLCSYMTVHSVIRPYMIRRPPTAVNKPTTHRKHRTTHR
jgi:hypothetical protein